MDKVRSAHNKVIMNKSLKDKRDVGLRINKNVCHRTIRGSDRYSTGRLNGISSVLKKKRKKETSSWLCSCNPKSSERSLVHW